VVYEFNQGERVKLGNLPLLDQASRYFNTYPEIFKLVKAINSSAVKEYIKNTNDNHQSLIFANLVLKKFKDYHNYLLKSVISSIKTFKEPTVVTREWLAPSHSRNLYGPVMVDTEKNMYYIPDGDNRSLYAIAINRLWRNLSRFENDFKPLNRNEIAQVAKDNDRIVISPPTNLYYRSSVDEIIKDSQENIQLFTAALGQYNFRLPLKKLRNTP
jgi:hypothetical protein